MVGTEGILDFMDKITQDKWANIRSERNLRLVQTDWCVLPDSPLSPELLQAIKDYRQQLRDITKNFTNPEDVVFPENPLEKTI